jgi:hypothetical protein
LQETTSRRLEDLINKGNAVLETHRPNPPNVIGFPTLDTEAFHQWRTQALALLAGTLGREHVYYKAFEDRVESSAHIHNVKAGIGILRGLLQDVNNGYLVDVANLVSAEVFTDFLDMAQHLLERGYKDPAASLCGAVLEDGLRRIAGNSGLTVRNREDLSSLNAKCAQKELYSRLMQKKIQVWADIRNYADHGHFSDYTPEDVKGMVEGVGSFLANALM